MTYDSIVHTVGINNDFYEIRHPDADAVLKTRETYLAWVAQWKDDYKLLASLISSAKGCRKQNTYAYRARNTGNSMQRRTMTGDNGNFHPLAAGLADGLSDLATSMLETRQIMKRAAGRHVELLRAVENDPQAEAA